MDESLISLEKSGQGCATRRTAPMILLCGGEGAAGVKTGGVFFLLVSYSGRSGRGGHAGLEAAAQRRAAHAMPVEVAELEGRRGSATGRAGPHREGAILHSV
jgi:hypothetical protein